MTERKPLITAREVAERIGVSPATVLRKWRSGDLPGYRLASNQLRFDADEVEAWLMSKRSTSRPRHTDVTRDKRDSHA